MCSNRSSAIGFAHVTVLYVYKNGKTCLIFLLGMTSTMKVSSPGKTVICLNGQRRPFLSGHELVCLDRFVSSFLEPKSIEAARKIQSAFRRYKARTQRKAAIVIQHWTRSMKERLEFLKLKKMAQLVQASIQRKHLKVLKCRLSLPGISAKRKFIDLAVAQSVDVLNHAVVINSRHFPLPELMVPRPDLSALFEAASVSFMVVEKTHVQTIRRYMESEETSKSSFVCFFRYFY